MYEERCRLVLEVLVVVVGLVVVQSSIAPPWDASTIIIIIVRVAGGELPIVNKRAAAYYVLRVLCMYVITSLSFPPFGLQRVRWSLTTTVFPFTQLTVDGVGSDLHVGCDVHEAVQILGSYLALNVAKVGVAGVRTLQQAPR